VSPTPKNILYIRADSFGDLVLFCPALQQILAAWPDASHTLLVRSGYESLASLFPAQVKWQTTSINPFKARPAEARGEFDALLAEIDKNPPDLIIAPTLNRTWLEVAIAARFPNSRQVALGNSAIDPLFITALRLDYEVSADQVFQTTVAIEPTERDWENNYKIVDYLTGGSAKRIQPQLNLPIEAQSAAEKIIAERSLDSQRWAAIYPAGVANISLKTWPEDRFADVVAWLYREHGIKALVLGHESEADTVVKVANLASQAGIPKPAVWLSKDGEIATMAAVLSRAALYLGNDTGPMHIAAAVNTPTIGIFGGGFWPRFRPVGRQVISVVQPLSCFGCAWDCMFGTAPCVKTLTVADVQSAVQQLFAAGAEPIDSVVEANNLPSQALALIAQVTPAYRQLQHDRLNRQYKIEELTHQGREKDGEISDLKSAADARKTEMESIKRSLEAECAQKDDEIGALKHETNTKDEEIGSLKTATNLKDTEIDALKGEADTKDAEISSLKNEANVKDVEISQLKVTCDEREALIFKLTDIVKGLQQQVASVQAELDHRKTHVSQLTAAHDAIASELERLKNLFNALPPDATQYAQWLYDKDVHIRNLENASASREALIKELQSSNDNFAHGFIELEQVKRYAKWLYEKENVIQLLKRACDEREALIRQLAVTNAGLSRPQKTLLAASQYVRQRVWLPIKAKVFKKVVEDYWMQLGILRHYDPRPITWDKKLPKQGRLSEGELPPIAIVTPSYNQDKFLESTMLSVLNQHYPHLKYRVQDGGSKDQSPAIIQKYADRLTGWESARDRGQSDAIRRGFSAIPSDAGDIMAWLNSDDLIAPRVLRFVGEYFARHPEVDAIYGHRIIIDEHDKEVGRWIMPRHDPASLDWIDYVPQETLFFRRRIWEAVGGLDPSFQFALDWDLLARFQSAGALIKRVPYFLGCFRVHSEQKTSAQIHTTGHEEMTRLRTRIHGPNHDLTQIDYYARKARFTAALTARLHVLGIRF
jgi:ADP-heptose:LPS heptosyltransferase/GT2 family glycosyltransferase